MMKLGMASTKLFTIHVIMLKRFLPQDNRELRETQKIRDLKKPKSKKRLCD